MISIGNDIVDLTAIDKHRTQQKAFYSKILSDKEQQLYSRSSQLPFEIYVWLLWSAKESVYKFAKRLNPELVFSPARIEIQQLSEPEFSEFKNFQNLVLEGIKIDIYSESQEFLNSENSGSNNISEFKYQITYLSNTYYLRSLISDGFIATVASGSEDFPKIRWGIKHIEQSDYNTQSQTVRNLTIERLEQIYPNNKISINKSAVGYPLILSDCVELNIPLSFAHHGHYISYAFAY